MRFFLQKNIRKTGHKPISFALMMRRVTGGLLLRDVAQNPQAIEKGRRVLSTQSSLGWETNFDHTIYKRAFFTSLILLVCMFINTAAFSQDVAKIQGTVSDEQGTLPGVSVSLKGTTTGTITNVDGKFFINAKVGQTLVFSFIGYNTKEVVIGSDGPLNVKLITSSSNLNEVVVVGYGTQKKGALTTAVSTITNSEIVTTKNENVINSIAGKIPGLRVVQNSAEPGDFNNSFDIRGMGNPLLVVDGVPRTDIMRIDPNDIESISVLKDASAAIYGVRAANGVILVTTKKGKKGALELNYTANYGLQVPIKFPETVGAVDWMTLVNEKSMHNVNGGTITYKPEAFEPYLNGTKQSANWYDAVMKSSAPQTQHNLSASGGSENTTYFVSLGYTGQDGILKSNDLNYRRYNVRSNLSTKVSKNLTFDLNLNGIMEQKNMPYNAPYWAFRSLWYVPPTTSVYANDNKSYLSNVANVVNPLALTDADVNGYQTLNNKWFQSSASVTYDIPFIQGLSIKGLYSYDYNMSDNKKFMKSFNLYNYDAAKDFYKPTPQQSPSTIRREFYDYPTTLSQFSLNYNHTFGKDTHHVNALVLYETSDRLADNFYAQRELSIPVDQLLAGNSLNQQGSMASNVLYKYSNAGLVGTFTYDYKSKYLADFRFRYDGSSKFGAGQQWGLFPAASLGWRISEEGFWKNASGLSFVNNLKFRASYGKTGDDSASSYQFITGYTYPASGSSTGQPKGSVFDGTFINGVQSKGIPNPYITWYTAKTLDIGFDLEAWNGLLGVTFDYYKRDRAGLLATQLLTLPDVVGAALPQQNLNGDRTQGFDFEVSHRNHIGQFGYNVRGVFGMTRTMNTVRVQAMAGNSYLNWLNSNNTTNRYNNIYWGYGANGQFESYDALKNSAIYVNKGTVVGDYRYQDWNGDGQVGSDDSHPIATTGLPLITFGLSLGASYKNFDVNLQLQGAAQVNASYLEQLNTPLWAGGGALSQFLDRYHPADPNANPYDPNTVWIPGHFAYTGTVPYTNTLANLQDASYVRLKSAEIGYTLPKKWVSTLGIKGLRVFANGYNLLTITGLQYMDPEHPSATSAIDSQYGYIYPLDKIYQFGVNVKF
ncbi:TonB-dependent receptor [Mucilaginibacter sp. AK015]|uniref:SusC/RagA family TonB-linked outer membrane protein n=1 Tax=Mucilaginibacter sp. AK015 TaxID=2723072 RepID=UPI0017E76EB0|nr:TonB-dependent receptor [Mucilaginibacter sp. AK015]MBB5396118.1 TonB-linked SusC/RagA family outer membrane protein [Mucilaginibacter sp. AK015]